MAPGCSLRLLPLLILVVSASFYLSPAHARRVPASNDRRPPADGPLPYLWPLPKQFRHGNATLSVDPDILFHLHGDGGNSSILGEALQRYRGVIFGYRTRLPGTPPFDLSRLTVVVSSGDEMLRLGVDESYTLLIAKGDDRSVIGEATIEVCCFRELRVVAVRNEESNGNVSATGLPAAVKRRPLGEERLKNIKSGSRTVWEDRHYFAREAWRNRLANTVYGAIRGLETFSQLCIFNYKTKLVEVHKAPWYIQDEPRFTYRGLMLDTSRHYIPVNVIKQVIESMSYAKLNVLHWHIIDEESFPLEVPSYPDLWKGSYTKWERFTVEDAYEIVDYAKKRGINIMPEIDVPGHAESWGIGYPDLWPSSTCREPLDVSKNFTFEVISGILEDMRQIFPFELFHLGGDEVHPGFKHHIYVTVGFYNLAKLVYRLQDQNMTSKEAYQYFVLRAQELAIAQKRTPVNWEETFNTFAEKLHPHTVVHNWWGPGVCPKVVEKGFRCIVSNQGEWYLDHLDVPWEDLYKSEPWDGIDDTSRQDLVIGGEVCMWSETVDTSDVQQTIWPRAAAAAERLWSQREDIPTEDLNVTALPRLEYFRCLLNQRGVPAAPVTNFFARQPPIGPGSCYVQ
ncbi:hypothetical protein Taro_046615 [Colocasia esculenta]|uniref:Beta-hexosaminidase n=1 Tax=Colocasia esculenta TaxID=4460 RepID=A0A843WSW9_COLES|nr:hypothetical protein [Colocasia esculenta]